MPLLGTQRRFHRKLGSGISVGASVNGRDFCKLFGCVEIGPSSVSPSEEHVDFSHRSTMLLLAWLSWSIGGMHSNSLSSSIECMSLKLVAGEVFSCRVAFPLR